MLEDLLIVGGIVVVLVMLKKRADAAGVATIPTALGISSAPSTSAAYQVNGTVGLSSYGFGSDVGPTTYIAPAPVVPPPPPFYGGTVGSVGSGGNPLGGALRAGVSAGTATTAPASYRAPTAVTSYRAATADTANRTATAIDPAALAARRAAGGR